MCNIRFKIQCICVCSYLQIHTCTYVEICIYIYMSICTYMYACIYMCALVDVIRIDVLHSSGGGAFLEVVVSFTAELLPDSTWRDA